MAPDTPAAGTAAAHLESALSHHRAGRWAAADAAYRAALAADPDSAAAWNNYAVLLRAQGDAATAVAHLRRAVELRPDYTDAYYNLGNALGALGRAEEAIACYRRAVALRPDYAAAHGNLGLALANAGRLEEAEEVLGAALRRFPERAELYFNLGVALWKRDRLAAALSCFRRGLAVDPGQAQAHHNLGAVLARLGRLDAAADSLRRALEIAPASAAAQALLGQVYASMGRRDDALAAFDAALAIDPQELDAHLGRARTFLLQGEFAAGWVEYEWRWRSGYTTRPDYAAPAWDGSPLRGRTILLYAEQGFGDILQFARYIPLVAARGGRVLFQCPHVLHRLLAGLPGLERLIPWGAEPPDFDFQAALLSLPRLFATDRDSIPAEVPYLHAPDGPPTVSDDVLGRGFRLGIAWAGNRSHKNDLNRSLPLERFLPLLEIPGTVFSSLQKGAAQGDIAALGCGGLLANLDGRLRDFADTAAVVARLDLVITVDTAVAHLAGAMGRPCWVLLPYTPDWRWLLRRPDSPWYPSLHLYRQASPGDWDGVFARVAADLRALAAAAPDGRLRTGAGAPPGRYSVPGPGGPRRY